jgi:FixJ family two-component response regulator
LTLRWSERDRPSGQLDSPSGLAQLASMADASPKIAIVDDDASVLKALTRLLRAHAFRTQAYASARDFLADLPDAAPDCLILDLQMPEMSGIELLQFLTGKGMTIPTIIITAQGDAAIRQRCDSMGAIAFLTKPLQDSALFAALDKVRSSTL